MASSSPAVDLQVGDRTVRLSNPDRVYFPDPGLTKIDLARYYLDVGDGIVNALRERPCMLHRFPDGTTGEVRGHQHHRRLRLTWLPPDAEHDTTIQFTVQPVATGTALSFLQERMRDADERERRLVHWTGVVDRLVGDLDAGAGRS